MGQSESKNPTKVTQRRARDERLAEALRANLRRRKGQKKARASDEAVGEAQDGDQAENHEDEGALEDDQERP